MIKNSPMVTHAEIDERFSFHPTNGRPGVGERHDYVRYLFRQLAHELVDHLPAGRDQALALTALEDAMMRSNRAIALHYSTVPPTPPPVYRGEQATPREEAPPRPKPIPGPVPRPPSAYAASRPRSAAKTETPKGEQS